MHGMETAHYANAQAGSLEVGQVTRELHRQSSLIEELHMVLNELDARTAPIRLGRPEPGGSDPSAPQAVQAELADSISRNTDALAVATRRIRTVLSELEL